MKLLFSNLHVSNSVFLVCCYYRVYIRICGCMCHIRMKLCKLLCPRIGLCFACVVISNGQHTHTHTHAHAHTHTHYMVLEVNRGRSWHTDNKVHEREGEINVGCIVCICIMQVFITAYICTHCSIPVVLLLTYVHMLAICSSSTDGCGNMAGYWTICYACMHGG